jgi:LmbE family N-acetylglucosaminyl deacetylase
MSEPSAAGVLDRAALIGPTRHLFLSPHYDDVALSCGGTALLLAQADRRPEVVVLFGAEPDSAQRLTPFALGQHEGWGLGAAEAIAARRAEEAAAAAILGTRVQVLPFRDAIYRGERYTSDDRLFAEPHEAEAGLPLEIVAALGLSATPDGETRIYAPLAIGSHVDHRHGADAGVALARGGWDVLFYEDLPYALHLGAEVARSVGPEKGFVEAGRVGIGAVWEAKIDAIHCYPSQLTTIFGFVAGGVRRVEIEAVMHRYALALGGEEAAERFWRLESAGELCAAGLATTEASLGPESEKRPREGIDRPSTP